MVLTGSFKCTGVSDGKNGQKYYRFVDLETGSNISLEVEGVLRSDGEPVVPGVKLPEQSFPVEFRRSAKGSWFKMSV